ncbi:MAG: 4Fe-4S dicluster domain-containing protein, partial [Oscillospiraceae bacterium]
MNNIKDNFDCCGCSACINICPKKCISFKQDKEGFDIPHIDENQCINCGM